jgi:hypothetical protein
MQKFYTISFAAGLIRSNKFMDKADAVCVASNRAEQLGLPVKIYEHKDEPANRVCVLICNPDGTAKKPEGAGYEVVETDHNSGARNNDQAHILLSSYDEQPITTVHLKKDISESLAAQMEKDLGVDIGLYDPQTLHVYSQDSDKIKALEAKLSESSLEVDRITEHMVKRNRTQAEAVTSARKAQLKARSSQLPELSARASMRNGGGFKFNAHCEMHDGTDKASPKIAVYIDGSKVQEVKSKHEAAEIISEEAVKAFNKFIKKELA